MEQFLHALSGSRTLLVHFIIGRVCWPAAAGKKVFVSITGTSSKQSRKAVLSGDGSAAIQGLLSIEADLVSLKKKKKDVKHSVLVEVRLDDAHPEQWIASAKLNVEANELQEAMMLSLEGTGWDGSARVELTTVTPTSPVKAAALWELDWESLLPVASIHREMLLASGLVEPGMDAIKTIVRARAANYCALDLGASNLTGIPYIVGECDKYITSLSLGSNSIERIPILSGLDFQFLHTLSIARNQLREVSQVGALHNLRSLDLQGNCITAIPPEWCMLTSLEVLNLNKNNISGGSLDIVCALPKLQELHISSNPVGELPRLLGACSLLEVLSANECALDSIPVSICCCANLMELHVARNKIRYLPSHIGMLRKLFVVDVSDNLLWTLPYSIAYCTVISQLRFVRNRIRDATLSGLVHSPVHELMAYLVERKEEVLKELDVPSQPPSFPLDRSVLASTRDKRRDPTWKAWAKAMQATQPVDKEPRTVDQSPTIRRLATKEGQHAPKAEHPAHVGRSASPSNYDAESTAAKLANASIAKLKPAAKKITANTIEVTRTFRNILQRTTHKPLLVKYARIFADAKVHMKALRTIVPVSMEDVATARGDQVDGSENEILRKALLQVDCLRAIMLQTVRLLEQDKLNREDMQGYIAALSEVRKGMVTELRLQRRDSC